MSRDNGASDEKLLAIGSYSTSPLFDEAERVALEYADGMTLSHEEVEDELFERVRRHYAPEQIVELTCTVAFENFLSKFHRALRVEEQGFCPVVVPLANDVAGRSRFG